MSVQINISGTIIDFPSSAQSPNWAPALIEFAQTVAASLGGIVGPYDIAPQVVDILNDNAEHPVATPGVSLGFPTSIVRAANIRYSVYRNNTANENHAETGILTAVYNSSALTWELQREFVGNVTPQGTSGSGLTTSGINFRIDNNGQVFYTAHAINSVGYNGKLSFAAQALLQTS
jgi:hypothetical protein